MGLFFRRGGDSPYGMKFVNLKPYVLLFCNMHLGFNSGLFTCYAKPEHWSKLWVHFVSVLMLNHHRRLRRLLPESY